MNAFTITRKVHIVSGRRTQKELRPGAAPPPPPARIPRVSKLVALAIHFDDMVRTRQIANFAAMARFGQVSRARMTQIVNLALLAADIQEELLFLPRTTKGRDVVTSKFLERVACEPDWHRQREMWAQHKTALPQLQQATATASGEASPSVG